MTLQTSADIDLCRVTIWLETLEELKITLEAELYPTSQSVTALLQIETELEYWTLVKSEIDKALAAGNFNLN